MTETAITSEIEEQLLRAYLTETPRPSERNLAKRFGVSASSIHRLLARHKSTLTHALAQTKQPNQNEVTAALVVAAIPEATERVVALSKDLTVSKMRQVLEQCESQYNSLRNDNPQLAGAYLKEMRQTLESLAKWLNFENQVDIAQIDHATDSRCDGCPLIKFPEGTTFQQSMKVWEDYLRSIEDPCCRECPLRYPEKYSGSGPERLKDYFRLLEDEGEVPPISR
jgi:plasmid maintenance system antidote protein VapI